MTTTNTTQFSRFLRETADKLDNNSLTEDQQRLLVEFYARYNYTPSSTTPDTDLLKYLSMGYYIYEIVEQSNNSNNS